MKVRNNLLISALLFIPILSIYSQGIVIGEKNFIVDTLVFQKQIGPGVYHSSYRLPDYPLDFKVIEVDLTNPYNEIETVKAYDKGVATEQPTSMAKRKDTSGHEVVGGTNGDFYFYQDPPEIGIPRSGQFLDGEMIANPTGRASFILSKDKKPYIDRINFRGDLYVGESHMRIHTVNMLRLEWSPYEKDFLTLYTDKFGTSTSAIEGGTKVIIRPAEGEAFSIGANDTIKCIVESVAENQGVSLIPKGKAVLHGRDKASDFLKSLKAGDECRIAFKTRLKENPNLIIDFKEQVGGSNAIVLRNGNEKADGAAATGLHPRTGMGFSKDSTRVYMVVVDGRSGLSKGLDLKPFGQLFKAIGAWNAVNLDGGGSSVMFINDQKIVNKPSGGKERPVGNGVLVVSNAPEDSEIKIIRPIDKTILLPRYGFYKPIILGYNQYGALLVEKLNGVTFSVNPELGEIRNDSIFFFSGIKDGVITAKYNGAETTIKVKQVKNKTIDIRLDSILIDQTREYPIEVNTILNNNTLPLYPDALDWEIRDKSICEIRHGALKGLQNGYTYVIGSLGDFKDSLLVKVEIPARSEILVDSFKQMDWKMKSSSVLKAKFSNTSLPNDWNYGATIAFTYKTTRSPYIKLEREFPLYSLPDTLKIKMDTGDVIFSKAFLSLRSNNNKTSTSIDINDFKLNSPTEVTIVLSDYFDTNDIATYPVWFEYINLYLDSKLKNNKPYTIALKEIDLCYKNLDITGLNNKNILRYSISPNPTKDKVDIYLNNTKTKIQQISLHNISGQLIRTWDATNNLSNKIELNLNGINPGVYLMKIIDAENNYDSVKIIKH